MKYTEYKGLNLPEIGNNILEFWNSEKVFEKSISGREGSPQFTFYEGPPSANGLPGIHHVMARGIKDIFCRFKTLKGFKVERKGGWDTHGLPIEISVEKSLGITKDDIGKKISIEDYNKACKEEVLKYTHVWNDLTQKMGYWVDLENSYITYKTDYIETLWWILKEFYKKGLLYKGYTVQPYSPAAGTGLSSHELNQPGTYKMVRDTSIVAQFKIIQNSVSSFLFEGNPLPVYFLAWTTTPWTLPSNCALAIGKEIDYVKIKTLNPYTYLSEEVILARDLVSKYFSDKAKNQDISEYKAGDKHIPWMETGNYKGKEFLDIRYEQLMPYVVNDNLLQNAFRVIPGDFVTTEDGTGIVHTASIFGSDDFRVCKENGVPSVMGKDDAGNEVPLVNKQGKFTAEVVDFAGMFVKSEYESDEVLSNPAYKSTDVLISIKLKEENKAFKVEKYEHSYPHCWRTDKPILYYPLDSWFVRTTDLKEKLVELNKTIQWKPESTGTGRFGNWLENLVDWNLSRSRFWGTPLPIWRTEDNTEQICIGSLEELKLEISKSLNSELLNPAEKEKTQKIFEKLENGEMDLHRPYVDDIILVSSTHKKMFREPDLIDVWFDSGAMPYAQWHYPFENQEIFETHYPADFIAEGVDQTRGWFFTLHAISVLLFGKVSFKNVVSNGLVLDKNGNKMSKRLGNAVDPFKTIEQYGPDATRWYMIANAAPWENLKFNLEGLAEVSRKFFGTLYNAYSFFALYANIDGYNPALGHEKSHLTVHSELPEIDRWILSLLHSLIREVNSFLEDYEPTKACRAIQEFVDDHLSNWYIRLSRRRFWKGEMSADKLSAYNTLYECLETLSKLISPIAPFFADQLFRDLHPEGSKNEFPLSVHLTLFPVLQEHKIDPLLEERMDMAQKISSLVLSLRKKVDIKVRQPLQKLLIPVASEQIQEKIEKISDLVLSETNVKEIEFIGDSEGLVVKKVKPNYKKLGPKTGKKMKAVAEKVEELDQEQIKELEKSGFLKILVEEEEFILELGDTEILREDIPGWLVAFEGNITVALDISLNETLIEEGIARELINRIQNLRKEKDFLVTDTISIILEQSPFLYQAVSNNLTYICAEILGTHFEWASEEENLKEVLEIDGHTIKISLEKNNARKREN